MKELIEESGRTEPGPTTIPSAKKEDILKHDSS